MENTSNDFIVCFLIDGKPTWEIISGWDETMVFVSDLEEQSEPMVFSLVNEIK